MADDFTRIKFQWLENVAADLGLPASACRLAIVMSKHFNRTTRDAFPSVRTLARATGMSERNLQGVLHSIAARGHLAIEAGGGRGATNRYRPIVKMATEQARGGDEKPRSQLRGNSTNPANSCGVSGGNTPQFSAEIPRSQLHPNPLIRTHTRVRARSDGSEPSGDRGPTWREFEAKWLFGKRESREPAREAFEGLAEAERVVAISGVEAAIVDGRPTCTAREYLRGRRWLAPGARHAVPQPAAAMVYAPFGSEALAEWDAYLVATVGKTAPRDRRGGWWFDTERPPILARAVDAKEIAP